MWCEDCSVPLPNLHAALGAEPMLSAGGPAPSGPDVQLPSSNSRMLIPAWHGPDRPSVVASSTPFVRANGFGTILREIASNRCDQGKLLALRNLTDLHFRD
jgi:hypothetical protein